MTEFYIVRHGQTLFNVVRRVQGWCDSPLTEEGIAQAKHLNQSMKELKFDAAYSSTQERAIDTCKYIIDGWNIPRYALKGLKEVHFGDLEGEIAKEVFVTGKEYPNGFKEAGGENIDEAISRYLSALEEIAKQYPNGKILVISHGTMLTRFLRKVSKEFASLKGDVGSLVPNCSLTKVNYDGKFHVEYYSDTRYL